MPVARWTAFPCTAERPAKHERPLLRGTSTSLNILSKVERVFVPWKKEEKNDRLFDITTGGLF
jgi:hypothetical protein